MRTKTVVDRATRLNAISPVNQMTWHGEQTFINASPAIGDQLK
jgi:hypothetical protein